VNGVLAGYVATDAVPLLSLHNSQGPNCCSQYPAAKPRKKRVSTQEKWDFAISLRFSKRNISRSRYTQPHFKKRVSTQEKWDFAISLRFFFAVQRLSPVSERDRQC